MATRDGRAIARLFPRDEWVHGIALNGPATLDARVTGQAADLHIAGTLASHRFSIRGVQAENVTASFKLTPSDTTTLSAGVTVQRLQTGNVTLDNIAITVSSATPWRQLESAPVLTGTVRAARARLPWFTLPDLSGDVAATTDGIAVTNLRTAIFSGATAASLRIPFLSRTTVARAEADFADMNLAQLSRALHLPSLAGHISGHLALRMLPGGGMTLNTRIHSSDAAYREYETSHLDADLRIDVGNDTLRVTIPRAFARTAYGEFTAADGRYQQGMEGVGLLTMALRGERIPLAMFGDDTEYGGYATLVGTLSGDPLVPMLTAAVTVNDGMLLGRAFTEGIGKMTYQAGGALRFRDVVLTRPGLRLEMAGGTDGFDPRDGMVGQEGMLHLQGAPLADVLNIVGLDFPWQVDGGMRGVVALHVGERGITARGTTFIPDTVVHIPHGDSVFPLDLRRIALDFDYADRTLQVRNLRLERRDTLVMATGTVQCPLGGELNADLTYQAADTELGDIPRELLGLPVRLSGAADIHGFLRGDLNGEGDMPLTVTATAKAPRFTAAGFPLGSGDIALTYTYRPQDRQVIFDHLTVENAAFTARASGRYLISRGEVGNVEISVDPLRLEKLPTALSEMSGLEVSLPGEVSGMGLLRLRASGPVMKPSLHAEVALRDGTFGSTLLPNLQATLTGAQLGSRYQLRLENALASDASGTMLARANGVIFGDGAPDLRFSARDITPKLLTTWIDSSLPIGGSVDVDGTLRGSWLSPVAEIEVAIDTPSFGDRVLHRASGHLRLTRTGISLADGEIWFHANGPPITTQGTLPLRWEAWVPAVPVDEPFALDLTFPRQALSPWLALLPGITDLRGSVEGSASIHGTLKQPILRNGHLTITGSADLPETTDGNPDRADDIEMRLSASGDRRGVSLDIEHLSMRLDRVGAKAFQPGWLSSEGTVHIPASVLRDPQRWQWDVYAKLMRVPLSTETFLVPQATGYLRLGSAADGLELTGILLIDNTKLKKPSLTANAMSAWGPFPLNPHLRVVVQVGDAVKLKSGIFSVPLRPTPLAQLPATTIIPGVQPSLAIDRDAPEYRTSAAMMNVGTANEMTGTWGVIIGTLNDPAIYARFEVEKSKVGFPLKLFSAVRNARGHITFSRAGGPRIVMGIPEFPIASTPTARAATP